jgi:dienelactone hydrolase
MPAPVSSTFTVGTASYSIDTYGEAAGSAKQPVVIVLHGIDGMVGESATEIGKLASQIAGDGYLVFVPYYLKDAAGQTGFPSGAVLADRTAQVDTYRPLVAAAVAHALTHAKADAARVGVVGLSLGGGLALWFAGSATSVKVKAMVDFFGYIPDPAVYASAGTLPPTLVFHNAKDALVSRTFSDNLIKALAAHGVAHDSEIYDEPAYPERYDHTFRPGGKADIDSRARTRKWLDAHVK